MTKIEFWKDSKKDLIDPTLFSIKAENLALEISKEIEQNRNANKRTQIRKFYDEVVRLDMEAKAREGEWQNIAPLVHMLTAKAAYAKGRSLISDGFLDFIRHSVEQVNNSRDLSVFANFFEAFMGFYRLHGPKN
ncbi:MAG: type III-A CRISPR-associated protein Csm2 [Desulfosalsimonadaceae bacterium]